MTDDATTKLKRAATQPAVQDDDEFNMTAITVRLPQWMMDAIDKRVRGDAITGYTANKAGVIRRLVVAALKADGEELPTP